MLQRRHLVAALAWPWLGGARAAPEDEAAIAALRGGGVALLLRHALTDPGVGDPPGFRLDSCATQRQLSAAGRAQAQQIGAWFAARALRPAAVRASAWCRCVDTARLAFGRAEPWSALNSFFGERSRATVQNEAMLAALTALAGQRGGFEVWVTHQVNISAFNGESVAMGEAWLVRADGGKVHNLARLRFDA